MTVLSIAERIKTDPVDRERIVTFLRKVLADAEAGLVDCSIVLVKSPDGMWKFELDGDVFLTDMVGRIEVAKAELLKRFLEKYNIG